MRPTLAALALSLSILFAAAPADAGVFADRPLWLALGGSFGGGFPEGVGSPKAAGYGTLTLGLRLAPVVPEFTIREGFAGKELSEHRGGIAAGVRILLPRFLVLRPQFRVAFSHEHVAPRFLLQAEPFKVLFGTHDAIGHRTGLETGGGLEVYLDPKNIVRAWVQGTLMMFPGQSQAMSGLWEFGIAFGIGPQL